MVGADSSSSSTSREFDRCEQLSSEMLRVSFENVRTKRQSQKARARCATATAEAAAAAAFPPSQRKYINILHNLEVGEQ